MPLFPVALLHGHCSGCCLQLDCRACWEEGGGQYLNQERYPFPLACLFLETPGGSRPHQKGRQQELTKRIERLAARQNGHSLTPTGQCSTSDTSGYQTCQKLFKTHGAWFLRHLNYSPQIQTWQLKPGYSRLGGRSGTYRI